MSLYIGLMSGTSMDGVDAALVSFNRNEITIVGALTAPYPKSLRAELARAVEPDTRLTLHEIATLDINVGRWFARAAMDVLDATDTPSKDVAAIGSHGQTLRHSPETDPPYSIQIGDPATIAARCSITTVADFRTLDLASGGQGAPLVPAFHAAYFRDEQTNTVVVNIGGIANITVLPAELSAMVEGFDTGPGNCLLDGWIAQELGQAFDDGGRWGASGTVSEILLNALMADDYIQRAPPKSTGREYFNLTLLTDVLTKIGPIDLSGADIQATLAAFTAASITRAIEQTGIQPKCVYVCGGGAANELLMRLLDDAMPHFRVQSTAALNIDPDTIEALAFAWLAKQRIEMMPVQLTKATVSVCLF